MGKKTSGKDRRLEKTTEDRVLDDENRTEEGTTNKLNNRKKVQKEEKQGEVSSSTANTEENGEKENVGQTKEPSKSVQAIKVILKKAKDYATLLLSQFKPGMEKTFLAGVLLALVTVCVFAAAGAAVFYLTREPTMKSDFDLVKIFGNGVDELQQSFTNQTERFWKILKNRGLAHLRNKQPSQPLVFLLVAPPPAHEWVDCLATKLAEKLDHKQNGNLTKIEGNNERSKPADKTKKKIDEFLKEKFRAGHRVAVIHHLELLPPPSPFLFYSYCDDQTAPYKHVAIIFTVNLPVEPSSSLSPKEAEGIVEKYLANEVWSNVDKDAVAALLSRVADTVALMSGESSKSLKAYCS